jgi:hypothetical protein
MKARELLAQPAKESRVGNDHELFSGLGSGKSNCGSRHTSREALCNFVAMTVAVIIVGMPRAAGETRRPASRSRSWAALLVAEQLATLKLAFRVHQIFMFDQARAALDCRTARGFNREESSACSIRNHHALV